MLYDTHEATHNLPPAELTQGDEEGHDEDCSVLAVHSDWV